MKKLGILVFMFIWVLSGMNVAAECHQATKTANQKKIVEFMKSYYEAYNQYAQDAETIDLMDNYWAQEFTSVAYLPVPEYPILDLQNWKNFLVYGHMFALERLESRELVIDRKHMKVVSRINIKHLDRFSGALVLQLQGIGIYDLKTDANNNLKITRMKFFCSNPLALMELYNMLPN
jgi:hypothetical protein